MTTIKDYNLFLRNLGLLMLTTNCRYCYARWGNIIREIRYNKELTDLKANYPIYWRS